MKSGEDRNYDPRVGIAMARRLRGRQTQQELADELSRERREHWSRVMVAKLESGDKELSVGVLMSIAKIHDLPYSFYLEGPELNRAKGVYLPSPVLAVA